MAQAINTGVFFSYFALLCFAFEILMAGLGQYSGILFLFYKLNLRQVSGLVIFGIENGC